MKVTINFDVTPNESSQFTEDVQREIAEFILERLHLIDISDRLRLADDLKKDFELEHLVYYQFHVDGKEVIKS